MRLIINKKLILIKTVGRKATADRGRLRSASLMRFTQNNFLNI